MNFEYISVFYEYIEYTEYIEYFECFDLIVGLFYDILSRKEANILVLGPIVIVNVVVIV